MGNTTHQLVLPTDSINTNHTDINTMQPTPDPSQSPQASASTNSAIRARDEESQITGPVSSGRSDTQTSVPNETAKELAGELIRRAVPPPNHFAELERIAARFHGCSIEYRRRGTDWPQPWRVRIVTTKNERDDYRITVFGSTADEAVRLAVEAVQCVSR